MREALVKEAYSPRRAARVSRILSSSQRRLRQSLLGKVTNRLRVALRSRLHGVGLSGLPYTADELQAHISARLHARRFLCPMCGASLEGGFDIDHIVPLSSARTVDELLELFALSPKTLRIHRREH